MYPKVRPLARWLAAACSCLVIASSVSAQTVTSASVTGTVRDASEAVVPGATVDIRNHDINQVATTVTDARGRFRLQYLPVGAYHLSVRLAGFTTANANLTLEIGDQIDVPITLKPAAVTESVQVEAPIPLVEARRTELASAITPQEIDTLPLNGRNYLDLATLAPNVSRTNMRSTDRFAETSAVPGTGIPSAVSATSAIRSSSTACRPTMTRPIWRGPSSARKSSANSRLSPPAASPSSGAPRAARSAR